MPQFIDSKALQSCLRLTNVTKYRWLALAFHSENKGYRPASPRSSSFKPRDYVFGRVAMGDQPVVKTEWWDARFHLGPCDGQGTYSETRRQRARAAAGIDD